MVSSAELIDYLKTLFPNARCELNYKNNVELLIAVMLSSQTLDKRVNEVTEVLFRKYPTIDSLIKADIDDLKAIIAPLGLSERKSLNIKGIAEILKKDYDNIVPNQLQELIKLPGVGIKCANVVLIEAYQIPAVPVDTHVLRTAKRLELTKKNSDVAEAASDLEQYFDKKDWIIAHHLLIHFGRYFCMAKNPKCQDCLLQCNSRIEKIKRG